MSGGKAQNGIIKHSGSNSPGWVSNIGFSLSAGVFTITAADGTALSQNNPGWVTLPSALNAGQMVSLKITAPQYFHDNNYASTDFSGIIFNTNSGVAWNADMPLFIYAINADDTNANLLFGFSAYQKMSVTYSIGCIGKGFSSGTDSIYDICCFTSSDPSVSHGNKPCLRIGTVTGIKSSTGKWTLTLSPMVHGVGKFPWNSGYNDDTAESLTTFTVPTGQWGNTTGKYFLDNGGTAPVFTTSEIRYSVNEDGTFTYEMNFNGDGGADGAGAVEFIMGSPDGQTPTGTIFPVMLTYGATTALCYCRSVSGQLKFYTAAGVAITNAGFTAGARSVYGVFKIRYDL